MFKGVLCIIIVLACGALGIFKSQEYSQRVKELNDLRDIFKMLRTEISYMKDPLPVIFERIGNSRENIAAEILKNCSIFMKENRDIHYCWCTSVDMAVRSSCLTAEDKAIIYDLGIQLGRSSVQGQTDLLDMADEKLLIQIREAENHRSSKGKMFAGMGFSIGIVTAILLI